MDKKQQEFINYIIRQNSKKYGKNFYSRILKNTVIVYSDDKKQVFYLKRVA